MDQLAAPLSPAPAPTLDPASVEAWNEAYVTAESYLCALGLRNRLLLSRVLHRVLSRAEARVAADPGLHPSTTAMEETIRLVADWFSLSTGVHLPEHRLAARGRLALLLADLPGRHQIHFLADPPLPPEVAVALRDSYLRESPGMNRRSMTPRPISLNPIMRHATAWWEGLNRTPIFKALLIASALGALGAFLLLFFWR